MEDHEPAGLLVKAAERWNTPVLRQDVPVINESEIGGDVQANKREKNENDVHCSASIHIMLQDSNVISSFQ
jgi:hypothetical protein